MSRQTKFMDHSEKLEWADKYLHPLVSLFGVTVEGAENVPKKGHLIFYPNHGGWVAFDWFVLYAGISHAIGEYFTGFGNSLLFKIPYFGDWIKKCGALPLDRFPDTKFLKKYARIYSIAPEGADGTTKTFIEGYKLRPFRPGFIELAIRLKAKLVPITIVGNEDIFPVLFRIDFLKSLVGTPVPVPFTLFPLPVSRIKARLYPPIELDSYDPALVDDARFCAKMAEKCRRELQKHLDRDAKEQPLFKLNKFLDKILGEYDCADSIKSVTRSKMESLKKRKMAS